MKYRVTQYDAESHHAVHSEEYRWKWLAIVMAWAASGKGPGGTEFYTEMREI